MLPVGQYRESEGSLAFERRFFGSGEFYCQVSDRAFARALFTERCTSFSWGGGASCSRTKLAVGDFRGPRRKFFFSDGDASIKQVSQRTNERVSVGWC